MSIIDKVLLAIGRDRTPLKPSIYDFNEIDIDRLKKQLDILGAGRRNGSRNLPRSDMDSLDETEARITSEFEQFKNMAYNELQNQQRAYRDQIAALGFQSRLHDIETAVASAVAEFVAHRQNARNELYPARLAVIEIERELKDFRSKHKLNRPSRRPHSRVLLCAALLVMWLIESVLNARFFARGDEFGLLGGMMKAVVTAFINVGAGWFVGFHILPQLIHRNFFRKLLGLFGGITYLAMAGGFNLLVAHYRVSLGGQNPELADQVAVSNLIAYPFVLPEAEAWFLLALGLAFSIFSAIDGWNLDEPYPGYGRLSQRHADSHEHYTELMSETLAEIKEIKDRAESTLGTSGRDIQQRQAQYQSLIDRSHKLERTFQAHLNHLESAGNVVLSAYRAENVQYRKEPAPRHFQDRWSMQRFPLEPYAWGGVAAQDIQRVVDEARTKIPLERAKLLAKYEEAVTDHNRIEQLTEAELRNG